MPIATGGLGQAHIGPLSRFVVACCFHLHIPQEHHRARIDKFWFVCSFLGCPDLLAPNRPVTAQVLGSDLTTEYVKINADYRS